MPVPEPVPELPTGLVSGAIVLRDRMELLPLLPKNAVIAEVGVGLGTFSRKILDICQPARFIAIDHFKIHEQPELWGKPIAVLFSGGTHGDFYRRIFAAEIAKDQVAVIEAESDAGIDQLPDHSVDVFYIDGDHSYHAVRRDLAAAAKKIRPDGYLVLNDYVLVDHLGADIPYGVIYAAHEFMIAQNWTMHYFALQTSMFCDVVLRKTGVARPVESGVQNAELAAPRRELTALRQSRSWRLTAPLRRARAFLSRGGS